MQVNITELVVFFPQFLSKHTHIHMHMCAYEFYKVAAKAKIKQKQRLREEKRNAFKAQQTHSGGIVSLVERISTLCLCMCVC